jgi:hypothetical protein
METKELTTRHRIEILEDVLQKLESGDTDGGLCLKIIDSAYRLFKIWDYANKIIPILTLENAKKVADVRDGAVKGIYWWETFFYYDFENRIKFVNWMIEQEKALLNK